MISASTSMSPPITCYEASTGKDGFLHVLERPEIPINTNSSENEALLRLQKGVPDAKTLRGARVRHAGIIGRFIGVSRSVYHRVHIARQQRPQTQQQWQSGRFFHTSCQ